MWRRSNIALRVQAEAAENAAADAGRRADQVRNEISSLREEVNRLSMISEALWRVLQEQHGFPEEKLRAMVAAIEAAEKTTIYEGRTAPPCTKCGRPLSRGKPRCLYCGTENATDVFSK